MDDDSRHSLNDVLLDGEARDGEYGDRLNGNGNGNGRQHDDDSDNGGDDSSLEEITFWNELRELSYLSLPVALSTLCRLVIINTDVAFVGHLGKRELVASNFANTWSMFLSNMAFAPGYALNSLCSQAIGAGNLKLAGVWLQLAIFVTSIICVPVLAGYLLTKPVIGLMVDTENVPEMAQTFNNMSLLVLWPMIMYMVIRQFFQAMQVVTPAAVVSGITVGVNYLANYLFVPADGVFQWGLKGSPFATFLSMLFQICAFCGYTVWYKGYHKPYWGGWSWEFLQRGRVRRFSNMVLPMAVGVVLENSGLQLITFSTGRIGTDDTREALIAGHDILSCLWGVLWSLYWGAGLALQVRVGAYLGKGNVKGARMVARIAIVMVVVICSLVGVGAFVWRRPIAQLFTHDEDVIAVVEKSMYALVLDYFTGCMALCAVNLLEAMALNRVLMWTLSIGMWCVQVPCSLLFAYKVPMYQDRPVEGIWMGQICGEVFKLVILWGYIAQLDWEKMCQEAKVRSEMAHDGDLCEADDELESLLEAHDPDFERETQAMPTPGQDRSTGMQSAEVLASASSLSRSPFIGSRSPKFVRNV